MLELLDSSHREFHLDSLCVPVWRFEIKKRQKGKTLGGVTTDQSEKWSVLHAAIPACLNCRLRCVGLITVGFGTGGLAPRAGCLGPGRGWHVPEVLRALFGMWWETGKAGGVMLPSRAKSLIVGHRGAGERLA